MADTFPICLAFTLQEEGGWSNDPHDPGGCTMHGVTLKSFRDWKQDPSLTCNDLRLISDGDVSDFYVQCYWQPVQGESLPLGIDLMVMDAAVNMGISRSVMILQQQLAVDQDGNLGPITLAAVATAAPRALAESLAIGQTAYYRTLVDYPYFGDGWINRTDARLTKALAMMSGS